MVNLGKMSQKLSGIKGLADCHRIEVVHFLNPHLLWVEVIDHSNEKGSRFILEQIGIYGILPLTPFLDVVEENFQSGISDKWLPAASAIINNALLKSQEVWFRTAYIDVSTSIFDDNIHKYGEILLKDVNGKICPLSKKLIESGFAVYDKCLFRQKLGNGLLNTKLQNQEALGVIKNIENFYEKKKISKKAWEEWVKNQTIVARASRELELALSKINPENHNKELKSQLLHNKMKDLEMCKGIDQESVGRAFKAKHKRVYAGIECSNGVILQVLEPDSKSEILKRKLQFDKKENVRVPILPETKNILEQNGYNNHNVICDVIIEKENDELSQNYICTNTLATDVNNKLPSKVIHKDGHDQNLHFFKDKANEENRPKRLIERINGSKSFKTRVSYGPPGISPLVLPCKILTQSYCEEEQAATNNLVENSENKTIKEDTYSNEDSNASIQITNKDVLLNINQETKKESYHVSVRKTLPCSVEEMKGSYKQCDINAACYDDSSSDTVIQSSKSKILKKKLMVHEEKVSKILNSSFTSDTKNKDSSSSVEEIDTKHNDQNVHVEESDDENIDEIIKTINKEYPVVNSLEETKISKFRTNMENYNSTMKTFVNPFKNTDRNISSFTDKAVSPVLMVHTKMNKRIEPVFKISDVHFNTHIKVVLRNMSIVQPMMLQTVSWFCILRGYSMLMVSPPGSGKTLGYLPAVCRLISDSCLEDDAGIGPKCIIVCATAKSVTNVERMAKMFMGVKEKVLACYAGVNETYLSTSLLNGCDLLISTPSFLVRLLQITDFGIDMRRVATVVMDDCERLSEVYRNEVKYILYRIKDSIKSRTNKELKVQYVLASRIWCDFMESIAKKASYSVVCIGAFQECVIYSKANVTMNFVQKDNKMNSVHEFLSSIDNAKKIVLVCNTDAEVNTLRKALGKYNNPVYACDSSLSIQDLYNISALWNDYENPLLGPILLCCDDTLIHLNITDAHYLLNYSLPRLFSQFCKRFSVLNDNYPSIFKNGIGNVKVNILIEETDTEQLPKIINFIKRCTDNIPKDLNKICENVLAEKDRAKASQLVPVCDSLLSLGYCADFWNCLSRHSVFKDYDDSKEWVPKSGLITFKILHYHNAVLFSARLLSNIVNGVEHKYPQTYSTLSLKMGWFYSNESNKKPHGIPKVGDVCAVSMKQNLFVRCQIVKFLSHYPRGNPNKVLVNLIDEEMLEVTRDIYLFHLPEDLANIDTHVIQVRLANIQPKDRDVTFSNLARDELKKITDSHEDLILRGQAVMAVGNCVFVDTLEACQELSSLKKTVVKFDFKHDLLEKHATVNIDHLCDIRKLCEGKIDMEEEMPLVEAFEPLKETAKTLPRGTWAHLDSDDLSLVYFGSAISPHKFFVRLQKFESCLCLLSKEIQKYVAENPGHLQDVQVNELVLAMFPDDEMYERARIETIIDETKVQCFFLDQGDWRDVSYQHLAPIKEEFITQMPFQAIECRLVGVQPAGEDWTDFSTNWFCDKCFDETSDTSKPLYVKYFYKEKAECTGGNKYGIVMVDTNSEVDIVINQILIDVNMARENIDEMKYLKEFQVNIKSNSSSSPNEKDNNIAQLSKCLNVKRANTKPGSTSTLQIIFEEPIRSVPLVNSDCEDSEGSEGWHINMTDDFFKMFRKPAPPIRNLGSMKKNRNNLNGLIDEYYTPKHSAVKELDSDDNTSSESGDSSNDSAIKPKVPSGAEQLRKPKLIWRQNRNSVVIKIDLIGLQLYDILIEGRSLSFAANTHGVRYAFDLELYGAIDVATSSHCNMGQYILVKLSKILEKNWLTLSKDWAITKWIVYDMDAIDTSTDEDDEVDENKNLMLDTIRNIVNQGNTESEDDDFEDDLDYEHGGANALYRA